MSLKIVIDLKKIEKIMLNARKTIDGNILIFDHPDIDIMLQTNKSKIVAFPKKELDDEIYDCQKRLFDTLVTAGCVDRSTVQSGDLFMTMEATVPEVVGEGDKIQYCLYAISNFIEEELPFYKNMEDYEKEMENNLLEPEVDEYTELDPDRYHQASKGSLPPNMVKYGIHSIYRL